MHTDRNRFIRALLGAAMAVLVCADAMAQDDGGIVATVLGANITWSDLAAQTDDRPNARKLLASIWNRVAVDYVETRGLGATPDEIAELAAYDRRFEAKDRLQRARKLAELDQRLADGSLNPDQRAHLLEFQATLRRLANDDAASDEEPPENTEQKAVFYARWIEMWKMNKALHEEYGGVVARASFGPDPHGARAALLRNYEERGLLAIADDTLRAEVHAALDARPSAVIPAEQVDFTPYWKRPIPPSYFPD